MGKLQGHKVGQHYHFSSNAQVALSEQSTLAYECFDSFREDYQVENDQIDEETLCQLVSYADNLSKESICALLLSVFFQLPNDATLHELSYKKNDSHSKLSKLHHLHSPEIIHLWSKMTKLANSIKTSLITHNYFIFYNVIVTFLLFFYS